MDIRLRLAKNVKMYRLKIEMSQEELAHQSRLERSYVSGIERGVRNPSVAVLQDLAAVLKIRESDLLQPIVEPPLPNMRRGRKPKA